MTSIVDSPDSKELAEYEEYSRRELPRIFRDTLEEIINSEMLPMEEAIRNRLLDIIRDAQDRVFANYSAKAISRGDAGASTSEPALKDPHDVANQGDMPTASTSTASERFFQPPPPLAGYFRSLDLGDLALEYNTSTSDSAYMSEISAESKRDGSQEPIQANMRSVASISKDSRASSAIEPEMTTDRNLEATMPYPKPHPMRSPAQDAN
jgi:hypothetical protein